jgi:hypothetical protein
MFRVESCYSACVIVFDFRFVDCNVHTTEWDLGGFPPWLLSIEPALKLRSSDSTYISLVC